MPLNGLSHLQCLFLFVFSLKLFGRILFLCLFPSRSLLLSTCLTGCFQFAAALPLLPTSRVDPLLVGQSRSSRSSFHSPLAAVSMPRWRDSLPVLTFSCSSPVDCPGAHCLQGSTHTNWNELIHSPGPSPAASVTHGGDESVRNPPPPPPETSATVSVNGELGPEGNKSRPFSTKFLKVMRSPPLFGLFLASSPSLQSSGNCPVPS